MSNELIVVNIVMVMLAAMTGTVYAYMLRNTSPYAPSVLDYLGSEDRGSIDKPAGRAA
jgi:hypothetical protein